MSIDEWHSFFVARSAAVVRIRMPIERAKATVALCGRVIQPSWPAGSQINRCTGAPKRSFVGFASGPHRVPDPAEKFGMAAVDVNGDDAGAVVAVKRLHPFNQRR